MSAPTLVLGDVLSAAAHSVGIDLVLPDGAGSLACGGSVALGLPQARKVCVVLVDGLGWANLTERAELAPFLMGAPAALRLEAAFPSTTATNMAYFGTGAAGGATGMLGYSVRHPGTSGLLNLISWNGGADPLTWQRVPTIFERMDAVGRAAVSVGPWRFEGSGLTVAALRGSQFWPAESLSDRVDAALAALREPDVDLVYLYWGDVDSAGHQHGWRSEQWATELRALDAQLERLARRLPMSTTLLVTADHGMVDIPVGESQEFGGPARIDVAHTDELRLDVDLVAGEPRACHVHTRPGRAESVQAAWQDTLGERAWIYSREQAISEGLFGPVDERFWPVIGDVVVAARGDVAVHDSRTQSAASMRLIGMHGSLTDAERGVPLLVFEG